MRVQFQIGSLGFFIDMILPAPLFPGVDSASNRNVYQEYFQGRNGGLGVDLKTLPSYHVPIVMNSDSLKLLEPLGPVQGLLYCFTFQIYVHSQSSPHY